MEISLSARLGGKELNIQTGKLAKQASGSVLVQHGDTTVLVSAVSARGTASGLSQPAAGLYRKDRFAPSPGLRRRRYRW